MLSRKPALVVSGMYGMGDCLFQRAQLRELMQASDVTLETYYPPIYHDLEEEGLKLRILDNPKPRIRCRTSAKVHPYPANPNRLRLSYQPATVLRAGSIPGAMFMACGLPIPSEIDFSLPVPNLWRDWFRAEFLDRWDTRGKPIMVYRPIVLNNVWRCEPRSPHVEAYSALFRAIRDRFFVVSVCNLAGEGKEREWIVGPEQEADVKLHQNELDFETMAALFKESALVFGNAGFSPVLAQAVGTPLICVYGGKESSKTTQAVSRHLSPHLFVEPIKPCDCHNKDCGRICDKVVDLDRWIPEVKAFAERVLEPACAS